MGNFSSGRPSRLLRQPLTLTPIPHPGPRDPLSAPPTSGCCRPLAVFLVGSNIITLSWVSLCFPSGMAALIYHFTQLSGNLRDHLITLRPSRDGNEVQRGQGPQPPLPRPHGESEGQAPGFLASSASSSHCTTLPALGPVGPSTDLVSDEMLDSLCVKMCVLPWLA